MAGSAEPINICGWIHGAGDRMKRLIDMLAPFQSCISSIVYGRAALRRNHRGGGFRRNRRGDPTQPPGL